MKKDFHYTGENQAQISFPLGGIGTGCIGLAGNGHLRDWEIFNRPSKGSLNGLSHFALRVEDDSQVIGARILNGDLQPPYDGQYGTKHFYEGFGWGPLRETLAGMPHFAQNTFVGTFPIAQLEFSENDFPGTVSMEAFNPFIPHDEDRSSIPTAFFSFNVHNNQKRKLKFSITAVLGNPYGGKTFNRFSQSGGISRIVLDALGRSPYNLSAGNLCLATDSPDVSYQEYLFRGGWFDNLEVYWKDTLRPGPFQNRSYEPGKRLLGPGLLVPDNGLLSCPLELEPGEHGTVRFVIAWYHPLNRKNWPPEVINAEDAGHCPDGNIEEKELQANSWKNYYATLWSSAADVANYSLNHWQQLYDDTRNFRDALFSSTMPEAVIDAVSANISILKSPTVWRLENGSLYGWEGVGEKGGCCEGSCGHVWGYAQALPFLFPALARSMRENEFAYNWEEDGSMTFRLMLPLCSPRWKFRPAADSFFATIIKTFRDWKICGDDAWLKKLWPKLKKSLEFVWSADNPDLWDPEQNGILSGRQHHTLDMELFGPNAWLSGMYLAALQAGIEMAKTLGDEDFAKLCSDIFTKGKAKLNKELFNGESFIQKIDLQDRSLLEPYKKDADKGIGLCDGEDVYSIYWSTELGELKYQLGEGSSIDQMLGQWHADICGLGDIFDRDKARIALKNLMKYNFRRTMRNYYNPCRIYALNDESGLIICSWPDESLKPTIPAPYAQETMHGFEYAAADFMIRRGMEAEGLEVVQALRDRYDGRRRNPWNEFECGSNYARSMASYALLLTFSGCSFDGRSNALSFRPKQQTDFSYFWSLQSAWGTVASWQSEQKKGGVKIKLLGGNLLLRSLDLPLADGAAQVWHDRQGVETEIQTKRENGQIVFKAPLQLTVGDALKVY